MKNLKNILIMLLCGIMLILSLSACRQEDVRVSREYDFVISSGGGYNIVGILNGGYNNSDLVGVIDDNGNWIHPLSVNHPLIDENGEIKRTGDSVVVYSSNMTAEQRTEFEESTNVSANARRLNTTMSYRHAGGSMFEFVRGQTNLNVSVGVVAVFRYDARNNIILDD